MKPFVFDVSVHQNRNERHYKKNDEGNSALRKLKHTIFVQKYSIF